MLKDRAIPKIIRPQATIENKTNICRTFLLKLIGKNILWVPGSCTPINPAGRIARLVMAHIKEFHACTSLPGRDCAGKDARPAGLDGYTTET
jgi:hypothetical protein